MVKTNAIMLGVRMVAAVLIVSMLYSCNAGKEEVTAEGLLAHAREIEKSNPQGALLALDSIHELFRREVKVRRAADTVMWRIQVTQAKQSLPYVEEGLEEMSSKIEECGKGFSYSRDERYQDLGVWEHKKFRTENNTARNYLKASVNDHGEITLTSFYTGKECEHTSITVSVGGFDKSFNDLEDVTSFSHLGEFHEFISVSDDVENGVTSFIANGEGEAVVTLGGEKPTTYKISDKDREAFREVNELAVMLRDRYVLEQQKNKFTKQIEVLGQRLGL